MNVFAIILNTVLLVAIPYFLFRREGQMKAVLVAGWVLRTGAGLLLGLLYTYYYNGGDTLIYFDDAARFAAAARADFTAYLNVLFSNQGLPGDVVYGMDEPRALFLVKIASVFHLVTDGSYWLMACYFSLISFLGAWFLVKRITENQPSLHWPAILAFLFLPSVVFWTSGVIKESLVMGALFFVAGVFVRYWFTRSFSIVEGIVSLLSLWVIWKLKYYFAAVLLPVLFATIVFRMINEWFLYRYKTPVKIMVWLLVLVVPTMVMTQLHPNFSPGRFYEVIMENNEAFTQLSDPDDMIHFGKMETGAVSILVNVPLALVSGLFRPGVWEASTILQWAVALENLVISILTLVALWHWKTVKGSKNQLLLLAVFTYVFVLCVFITISTPNFGTLTRYRVGYLPFYVFLVLCNKYVMDVVQRNFTDLVTYRT